MTDKTLIISHAHVGCSESTERLAELQKEREEKMLIGKKPTPFSKLSRDQKRKQTVTVDGKKINVMVFLNSLAKGLQANFECLNRETGEPADQYVIVTKIYFKEGMEGVNNYVEILERSAAENAEGKIISLNK